MSRPAPRPQPPTLHLVGAEPARTPRPTARRPAAKAKAKPAGRTAPPRTEAQRIQQLLPDLGDGGRWTAENEGYGWKIRRLYDGKRPSQRYFSLRWATWDQMKETHDTDTIRRILGDKVADKHRRLAAAA